MLSGKKILFASNFSQFQGSEALANAFEGLGAEVFRINGRHFMPEWRSVIGRVARTALSPMAVREYQAAIFSRLKLTKFDLFFTMKGLYLNNAIFETIKSLNTKSAIFYPDRSFSEHKFLDIPALCCADYFFTTKSFQLPYLTRRRANKVTRLVHHGYIPGLHQPYFHMPPNYDFDICYIGNHSVYKESWLKDIISKFSLRRIGIFGNRWPRRLANSHCVIGSEVVGSEYSKLIQSSKINIALHAGPSAEKPDWQDLVSTRTFEIPACMGFMLHIDNTEVRSLFSVGSEIDVFRSQDELSEKINYYLAADEARTRMCNSAYKRAVPSYSYITRAQEMASVIFRHDNTKYQNRPPSID